MAADFHRNARPQGVLSPSMKDSPTQKAAHYRERAAQLREMAATAPTDGDLKDKLLTCEPIRPPSRARPQINSFGARLAGGLVGVKMAAASTITMQVAVLLPATSAAAYSIASVTGSSKEGRQYRVDRKPRPNAQVPRAKRCSDHLLHSRK